MNCLISVCKVCIGIFFGLGMKVIPFLKTSFCVSVRVVFFVSMIKASRS